MQNNDHIHHQEDHKEKNKKVSGEKKASKATSVTIRFNKDFVVLSVLALLLAVSIYQTAKLSSLKASMSASPAAASLDTAAPAGSGTGSPSNLDKLPSQVGGC